MASEDVSGSSSSALEPVRQHNSTAVSSSSELHDVLLTSTSTATSVRAAKATSSASASPSTDPSSKSKLIKPGTAAAGGQVLTGGVNPQKIYIGFLPDAATLADLEDCFGQFGPCTCAIKKGFGFAEYANPEHAKAAVVKYHEGWFLGAQITVELSHARVFVGKGQEPEDKKATTTAKKNVKVNKNVTCHRCGEVGHTAPNCTKKRKGAGRDRERERDRDRDRDREKTKRKNPGPGGDHLAEATSSEILPPLRFVMEEMRAAAPAAPAPSPFIRDPVGVYERRQSFMPPPESIQPSRRPRAVEITEDAPDGYEAYHEHYARHPLETRIAPPVHSIAPPVHSTPEYYEYRSRSQNGREPEPYYSVARSPPAPPPPPGAAAYRHASPSYPHAPTYSVGLDYEVDYDRQQPPYSYPASHLRPTAAPRATSYPHPPPRPFTPPQPYQPHEAHRDGWRARAPPVDHEPPLYYPPQQAAPRDEREYYYAAAAAGPPPGPGPGRGGPVRDNVRDPSRYQPYGRSAVPAPPPASHVHPHAHSQLPSLVPFDSMNYPGRDRDSPFGAVGTPVPLTQRISASNAPRDYRLQQAPVHFPPATNYEGQPWPRRR